MASLAVVGNLSRDHVDGGPPRIGGAPFHAARALRALGSRAVVVAKCAQSDRLELLPPLIRLGVPVLWRAGSSTAGFSFRYEGDRRVMSVDALGEPWTPAEVRGLGRAPWVHVGALAHSDFPAETLEQLARDRRLLLDGQGLVRPPRTGPLELDPAYDPAVLQHVSVLKLAEEEARVLVGEPDEESLRSLGWPLHPSPATSTRPVPAMPSPLPTWSHGRAVMRPSRPRGRQPRSYPACSGGACDESARPDGRRCLRGRPRERGGSRAGGEGAARCRRPRGGTAARRRDRGVRLDGRRGRRPPPAAGGLARRRPHVARGRRRPPRRPSR